MPLATKYFEERGLQCSDVLVEELFNCADANKDGGISFEEFLSFAD